MNMNKLKLITYSIMGEYNFSSNEIENQVTFLKYYTKYHTIILPYYPAQKQVFP